MGRVNAEHWAGRLYMRRCSPYLTRLLIPTGLTADAVTWLMIASGVFAAAALTIPGLFGPVAALLLVQLQLLLDCADGELARWRHHSSPLGIYLDRIGHYATEAALPVALGIRADGGWGSIDGWTTVGLLVAVLVLMVKSETDLVHVARALSGRPPMEDVVASPPRPRPLRALRRLARFVPFYRAYVAVEFTFLAMAAALADAATGALTASRVLVLALVAALGVTVGGHLLSTVSSSRLR